jgi:phospholipase/carboxylesterase
MEPPVNMEVATVELGGLRCRVVRRSAANEPPKVVVVLCHGYGAPGTDLVGLAEPLLRFDRGIAERVAFIFPEAPLSLAAQGYPGGRAWWHIDLQRLLSDPSPATLDEFRRTCPEGLAEARAKLTAALEQAAEHYQLELDHFVLGGFSQGSMLATDVSLHLPSPPGLLCILSGAPICEPVWKDLAAKRGPLIVLQTHGRYDDVLLFSEGVRLRELLHAGGADVEFIEFPGYHEIGLPALTRFAGLLREKIAD